MATVTIEPVAIVKQRASKDCFLCCLVMAMGTTYEAATDRWGAEFVAEVGQNGLYGRDAVRQAFSALGLEMGRDYQSMLGPSCIASSFSVPAPKLKALLFGRRAIVQVRSKNYEGQSHIVYWDGDRLFDPSPLEMYAWEEVNPEHIWIFREALAAARSEGKAEGMRWRTDVEDGVDACHVEAARFDQELGEWIVGIVSAPPGKPWTHWRHLGPMPDALPSSPADGETARQPMDSEALFDWLQEYHKSVGVTPALREAYRQYQAADADGETKP